MKTLIFPPILALAAVLSLAFSASAMAGSEFTSTESARFYPWTSISYCGQAESLADESAARECGAAQAQRQSAYQEHMEFRAGGGIMICTASALYRCE